MSAYMWFLSSVASAAASTLRSADASLLNSIASHEDKGNCDQEIILGNGNHSIKVEDTRFQSTPKNLGSKEDVYELNGQLYGGTILVRPYSSAAIVSSNGTTFVKAPRYKEAPRDEKTKETKRKKPSTTAIVSDPISISISTTTIAIVTTCNS